MKKAFKFISSRWLAILHDLLMVNISWLGAFILRFDTVDPNILAQAFGDRKSVV